MSTAIQSVAPLIEEIGRLEREIGTLSERRRYVGGLPPDVREDLAADMAQVDREIAARETRLFAVEAARDELRQEAQERAVVEVVTQAAERQAQEKAEKAQREILTAEAERLEAASAAALDKLQRRAIELGKAYADFTSLDGDLVMVRERLGTSTRSRQRSPCN